MLDQKCWMVTLIFMNVIKTGLFHENDISTHPIRTDGQYDCEPPTSAVGTFLSLHPNSKYLVFLSPSRNPFSYTYFQARNICGQHGLQMGEITSEADYKALQMHGGNGNGSRIETETADKLQFWLGVNDIHEEGKFYEQDGYTMMTYQAFYGNQPDNYANVEHCVKISEIGETMAMTDELCESDSGVLCQFVTGSVCHTQSTEVITQEEDGLRQILNSNYYLSNTQKTWDDALNFCLENRKALLTITNDTENISLFTNAKQWLRSQDMNDKTTFWTGGKFTPDFSNRKFMWRTNQRIFDLDVNTQNISYRWAPANDYYLEPFDQTRSGFETCVDISFEATDMPLWRASNCFLPKYFICMDMEYGIPKDRFFQEFDFNKESSDGMNNFDIETEVNAENVCSVDTISKIVDFDSIHFLKQFSRKNVIDLMKYSLASETVVTEPDLNEHLVWKKNILQLLEDIFTRAVSEDIVPRHFIKTIQNWYLLYLRQSFIVENTENLESRSLLWENIELSLRNCSSRISTLSLGMEGLELRFYSHGNNSAQNRIQVPQELIDIRKKTDPILDTIWYLGSFAIGICYPYMDSPMNWASQITTLFVEDFFAKFLKKWIIFSSSVNYGLLMGDSAVSESLLNLRAAVSAVYHLNDIVDRQIIRPLFVSVVPGDLQNSKINVKTGNFLF